jgi:hemerythrin-like domain-containing protein
LILKSFSIEVRMAFSDRFRLQHDQATIMVRQLRTLVRQHQDGDDTARIAVQLARLFSALRSHLAEEEQCLYRRLTATYDREAAALAQRYHREMGSLAWDWEEFMQRWSSSAVIALHFATFEFTLDRLLAALDARIECEDTMLYPIADALFSDLQGKAA